MAEAVGLLLGVLPLIISACEHYKNCLVPFVRYRHYTSRVDRFKQRLEIQKTVFRNECRILLESVIEHDVALRMVDDKEHPQWHDQLLEDRLVKQLDASKDACTAIIRQIDEQLCEVETDSRAFESALCQDTQCSIGDKAWRYRVGKKLKFSFSKSSLAERLGDLKALNDDFRTLSAQTAKLEERRVDKSGGDCKRYHGAVEKFRLIQKASQKVYEALGRSCTKHTEHLTHFCLDATAVEEGGVPQVRFKLSFTHLTLQGSAAAGDPIWFLIESINGNSPNDHIQLGTDSFSLVQTLKRSGDGIQELTCKKAKKSVHFQPRSTTAVPRLLSNAETFKAPRNLCMRKNFCDQLRSCLQRPPGADGCLGTLDDTDCYKHLIYLPSPSPGYGQQPAISLKQVILTLSKQGPAASLSQFDRVHLAHSLAAGVLRYHTTPWLKGSWRAEDIYFFGFDQQNLIEQPPNLSTPHLSVSVRGPDGPLSRASTFPPRTFAPNSLLFGLGVLLLEIGYTATLQSLQRPSDIAEEENRYTEFFVAKRLASSIGREMGSAYGKIVKKCLQCDFGCGDDLAHPDLQTGFYRDVVQELERLEDELRNLQLES